MKSVLKTRCYYYSNSTEDSEHEEQTYRCNKARLHTRLRKCKEACDGVNKFLSGRCLLPITLTAPIEGLRASRQDLMALPCSPCPLQVPSPPDSIDIPEASCVPAI